MQLYPDVLPTLERLARRYRLAVVSNIDDDLLGVTRLGWEFDLVARPNEPAVTSLTARYSDTSSRTRGSRYL
jgi:hypothetical protein